MRISSHKVLSFVRTYPQCWHEGLSEEDCRTIKKWVKEYRGLWKRWYWPTGKSYLFQSILGGNVYCISKKYFDSL